MPPAASQAQQHTVTDAGPLGIHLLTVDAAAIARQTSDQPETVGRKASPGTAPLRSAGGRRMSGRVSRRGHCDRVGPPVMDAVTAAVPAAPVAGPSCPGGTAAARAANVGGRGRCGAVGGAGGVETCRRRRRDGLGWRRRRRRQHRRSEGTPPEVLQLGGGRLDEVVVGHHRDGWVLVSPRLLYGTSSPRMCGCLASAASLAWSIFVSKAWLAKTFQHQSKSSFD